MKDITDKCISRINSHGIAKIGLKEGQRIKSTSGFRYEVQANGEWRKVK